MCLVNRKSIIFGTGFISKDGDLGGGDFTSTQNRMVNRPFDVIAVRGPLSRQKLLDHDIECPENYGDPLILMPCIYDKSCNVEDKKVGIIPHYIDKDSDKVKKLEKNLTDSGYEVSIIDIEIGHDYPKLIDEINACKYIISSSLHGVIMGLVYKKHTCFLEFSNKMIGDRFKFFDFFKSIDIDFEYKEDYTSDILNHTITIDYSKLRDVGINLIKICPFIDRARKNILIDKYSSFY